MCYVGFVLDPPLYDGPISNIWCAIKHGLFGVMYHNIFFIHPFKIPWSLKSSRSTIIMNLDCLQLLNLSHKLCINGPRPSIPAHHTKSLMFVATLAKVNNSSFWMEVNEIGIHNFYWYFLKLRDLTIVNLYSSVDEIYGMLKIESPKSQCIVMI